MISNNLPYSQFAQNYIEHIDNFRGLEAELEELQGSGLEVPESLTNEINRHKLIIGVFIEVGKEKFNKEPNEIYKDGWDFWIKEDLELREKRYGGKR